LFEYDDSIESHIDWTTFGILGQIRRVWYMLMKFEDDGKRRRVELRMYTVNMSNCTIWICEEIWMDMITVTEGNVKAGSKRRMKAHHFWFLRYPSPST
jgi:hypothetical protein